MFEFQPNSAIINTMGKEGEPKYDVPYFQGVRRRILDFSTRHGVPTDHVANMATIVTLTSDKSKRTFTIPGEENLSPSHLSVLDCLVQVERELQEAQPDLEEGELDECYEMFHMRKKAEIVLLQAA